MKPLKAACYVLFGIATLAAGISLFKVPDDEIVFDASILPVVCVASGCVGVYETRIGNTGHNPAQRVSASILWPKDAKLMLEPKVQTEGKLPRPLEAVKTDLGEDLVIGSLEPGRWIDLSFALSYPSRHAVKQPSEVLRSVSFEHGAGKPGSPTGTRFFRALWAMIDLF